MITILRGPPHDLATCSRFKVFPVTMSVGGPQTYTPESQRLLRLCAYLGKAKRSFPPIVSQANLNLFSSLMLPFLLSTLPCVATCDIFIFPVLDLYQEVPSSRISFLTAITKEPRNFKKDRGLFALQFEG